MKAVVVSPPKPRSAQLRNVPPPTVPAGGALIQVLRVGIDGTDRELQEGSYGKLPEGSDFMILGHEALGRVQKVGAQSKLHVGDLVVPTVRRPGECPNCRAGESDFCLDGNYWERGIWRANGYMAEAFAEDDQYLVPIPNELQHTAVLLEPISIAEKAWRQVELIQRRMLWRPRQAWVFGAGSLGILVSFVLRARELKTMVYSREPEDSLEADLIRSCGAEYLSGDSVSLEDLSKRESPDVIIEATGAAALVLATPTLVQRNGVVCLLGVSRPSKPTPLDEQRYNNEMVLGNRLVFGSVNSHRVDFEQGVKDLAKFHQLWLGLVERLFTRSVTLENYLDALDRRRDDIKVILELRSS